jgi:hypothetical protein
MPILKYIENVAVALDQLVNAIFGGDPDMTLSGRWGRAVKENKCYFCRWACLALNKLDKDHCNKQAIAESDEGKDQVW